MQKVNKAMLERQVDLLNRTLNRPMTYWGPGDVMTRKINVGHFHLDSAYGQYSLVVTSNPDGGETTVIQRTTKRDLLEKMHVLREGIYLGEAHQVNLTKGDV